MTAGFEKMFQTVLTQAIYLAFAALVMVLVGALWAFPVMWIWNWMMPDLFGLPSLNFWQAFWGTFMMKIVFGATNIQKLKK